MSVADFDPYFRTPLCRVLGCRYPILQAGMGGVARFELAAAVSEAGGFGSLGMVREAPGFIAAEVARVRDRTDNSFSVNLVPAATERGLFDAELKACADSGVEYVTFFWDVDEDAIAKAKSHGMTVLYQVGSLAEARAAANAGADVLIAQGVEAGGHVHGDVSSVVLLPQVCAAVDLPVVASGGFGGGQGLVAAIALGAQGIHCGTAFVATHESFAHDIHKRAIVEAPSDATVHTDAFVVNWPKGSPVRVLSTPMTVGLGTNLFGHDPADIEREQIAEEDGRAIYRWSTDSPLRNMTGSLDELALYAGQVCGEVGDVVGAAERVTSIMDDARAAHFRLTSAQPEPKGT